MAGFSGSVQGENLFLNHTDNSRINNRQAADLAAQVAGRPVQDIPALGINPQSGVPAGPTKTTKKANKQDRVNKVTSIQYVLMTHRNPFSETMKPGQLIFYERKQVLDQSNFGIMANLQTVNYILEQLSDEFPDIESVLKRWNFLGVHANEGVAGRVIRNTMTHERRININFHGNAKNVELLWNTTELRPQKPMYVILKKVRSSTLGASVVDPFGKENQKKQLSDKMIFQMIPWTKLEYDYPTQEDLQWEENGLLHWGRAVARLSVGTTIPSGYSNPNLDQARRNASMVMEVIPAFVRM